MVLSYFYNGVVGGSKFIIHDTQFKAFRDVHRDIQCRPSHKPFKSITVGHVT